MGIISVGGIDPDQEFIDVRMNAIKHKILILSGKGGNFIMIQVFNKMLICTNKGMFCTKKR